MTSLSPSLDSVIEHRVLVNLRGDPEVVARLVPHPFVPEAVDGAAVIGLCAVRLRSPRPRGLPALPPLAVDGAAHRIAVVDSRTGERAVWVPVRHTSSRVAAALGGRALAGVQRLGRFAVRSDQDRIRVRLEAPDASATVDAAPADVLSSRLFPDLAAASRFFREAPVAYSAARDGVHAEGLRLTTDAWRIEPATVRACASSVLDALPAGSLELDSALLMRGVPASWSTAPLVRLEREHVAA